MFFSRSVSAIEMAPCASGMVTLKRRDLKPLELSTFKLLVSVPCFPRRSRLASIGPDSPGARCHGVAGSFATVHPQEGRTLLMTISALCVLVSQNRITALESPALAV